MSNDNEQCISFQRTIRVRYEVDVFVAGGGPAGIAAALAAAGQKKSVYLAEEHSCFGGMGTAGLVPMFAQFTDGVNFVAGGIGRDVYERCNFPEKPSVWTKIKVEPLKRVYDDLIIESGVLFTFHTSLIGVEMDGPEVVYAVCSSKSGIFAVKAKAFVDGTGNGDLAAMAGASYEKGDEDNNLMPPTLCSLWADIDWDAVYEARKKGQDQQAMLSAAIEDGIFTYQDRHLPGMVQVGKHIGGGNIGHIFGVDGNDELSLTKGLVRGRRVLLEYEEYYKGYLKGYENMELVNTASLLGVRETRRITGDYVLSIDDFEKRAVFEDEIGRYCYPVDIHASKPEKKAFEQFKKEITTLHYKDGESYGIPYRVLTPRSLDNVLVGGRCISSDRYIQGSVRVMPGCFITGQAAGVAAAIIAEKKTSIHDIDVKELQHRLKAMGAFLPNLR